MNVPARPHVVEIEPSGLTWCKSSTSSGSGGQCVELAIGRPSVLVRDSNDRQGPRLAFPTATWAAFLGELQGGPHTAS
jgi:Domain of unknown function (DUF397)